MPPGNAVAGLDLMSDDMPDWAEVGRELPPLALWLFTMAEIPESPESESSDWPSAARARAMRACVWLTSEVEVRVGTHQMSVFSACPFELA